MKLAETTENDDQHSNAKSIGDDNIVKIEQTTKSKRDTSAERTLKVSIHIFPLIYGTSLEKRS